MSGEDLAAMIRVSADLEQNNERLSENQRHALHDLLLQAFQDWAKRGGFNVDKWRISGRGLPVNPLGDEMFPHDAALSLQRIAEFALIDPGEAAKCFYVNDTPEVPIALEKPGQPTIVIWAIWDGKTCVGEARQAMPATAALLVALEGCDPDEAAWKEPVKIYTMMEYGFRLGRYKAPEPTAFKLDSAPIDDDESIPF